MHYFIPTFNVRAVPRQNYSIIVPHTLICGCLSATIYEVGLLLKYYFCKGSFPHFFSSDLRQFLVLIRVLSSVFFKAAFFYLSRKEEVEFEFKAEQILNLIFNKHMLAFCYVKTCYSEITQA